MLTRFPTEIKLKVLELILQISPRTLFEIVKLNRQLRSLLLNCKMIWKLAAGIIYLQNAEVYKYDSCCGLMKPTLSNVVFMNDLYSLNAMLYAGYDINRILTKVGKTALHLSLTYKYPTMTKRLLRANADPTIPDLKGNTVLHIAVSTNHLEVVTLILDMGVNVNALTNIGKSALHIAARQGYVEHVDLLLKNGAQINTTTFKSKRTPLHSACMCLEPSAAKVVQLLLEKGADIDARDEDGFTPLHISVIHGNLRTLKLLLREKAQVNLCDKNGATCLHHAVIHDSKEICKCLISYGANVYAEDYCGNTPLDHFVPENLLKEVTPEILLNRENRSTFEAITNGIHLWIYVLMIIGLRLFGIS
jgi:ankyrin repeat protein